MLRNLIIIISVVLCCELVKSCRSTPAAAPPTEVENKLPKPRVSKLRVHLNGNAANTAITLEWHSIPQVELEKVDKEHPILGFKAKLWPEETKTVYHVENKDGVEEWVPTYESEHGSLDELDQIPKTRPIVVTVDQNATSVTITDVERLRPYQIRIQAFNDLGDGPYSDPMNFKILNE